MYPLRKLSANDSISRVHVSSKMVANDVTRNLSIIISFLRTLAVVTLFMLSITWQTKLHCNAPLHCERCQKSDTCVGQLLNLENGYLLFKPNCILKVTFQVLYLYLPRWRYQLNPWLRPKQTTWTFRLLRKEWMEHSNYYDGLIWRPAVAVGILRSISLTLWSTLPKSTQSTC